MRNSRYRYTRLVMALYAVGTFIGGFLQLAQPDLANEFHGFGSSVVEIWNARFIGLLMIALAVLLSATSRQVPDGPFRSATLSFIGINAIIALSLYQAPGLHTSGRDISTAIFGFISFLFVVTLPIKPVGYKEELSK